MGLPAVLTLAALVAGASPPVAPPSPPLCPEITRLDGFGTIPFVSVLPPVLPEGVRPLSGCAPSTGEGECELMDVDVRYSALDGAIHRKWVSAVRGRRLPFGLSFNETIESASAQLAGLGGGAPVVRSHGEDGRTWLRMTPACEPYFATAFVEFSSGGRLVSAGLEAPT